MSKADRWLISNKRKTVTAPSGNVRSDEIGPANANNGQDELTGPAEVVPSETSGSDPGPYPGFVGAESSGIGHHLPKMEQSEEVGRPKLNNRSDYEPNLQWTGSELPSLQPYLSHRLTHRGAGAQKRLISMVAMGLVTATVLFGWIANRDKRKNRIGRQPSQPISVPVVKQPQPAQASLPGQTSSSTTAAPAVDTADTPSAPPVKPFSSNAAAQAIGTSDSARVQGLSVFRDRDRLAVEVTTHGRVVPKLIKLTEPDRVVLELADTTLATSARRIPINAVGVKAVRMGTDGLQPPTTRVVVDLARPCEYKWLFSADKLTLQLRPSRSIPASSSNSTAKSVDTIDTASVQDVKVLRDQDRIEVEVTTKGKVVPTVTKLSDPDRVVIDLPDTMIETSIRRIDVNTGDVKTVRMGTNGLKPPTTRVVVDLTKPCEYALLPSTDKLILRLQPLGITQK